MPLVRLFILVAVLFVIYMLYRRYKARKQARPQPKPKPRNRIQNTVKCRYCGTYLPKSEAIQSDNGYYCSQKHQLADDR